MSTRGAYEFGKEKGASDIPVSLSAMMDDDDQTDLPPEKQGTKQDRLDMRRMGQTQEFRVCQHASGIVALVQLD